MSLNTNILIVDDDDVDVMLTKRFLRIARVENPVVVAKDGVTALEILHGRHETKCVTKPFIILLDWKMPRMDGEAFLKAIRADSELADSVVVVLSNSDAEEDRDSALKLGAVEYITKARFEEEVFKVIDLISKSM